MIWIRRAFTYLRCWFRCFWNTLQTATASTSNIFECWAASSLAIGPEENQSAVPCGDVIRSDWVRPIGLRHLEFHARTLFFKYPKLLSHQHYYVLASHATSYLCLVIKILIYLIFWPLYDTYLLFCFVFVFSALHDFDLANIFHINKQ